MDRVELAFRKFDLNKDGFLSREEFDLVSQPVFSCATKIALAMKRADPHT